MNHLVRLDRTSASPEVVTRRPEALCGAVWKSATVEMVPLTPQNICPDCWDGLMQRRTRHQERYHIVRGEK